MVSYVTQHDAPTCATLVGDNKFCYWKHAIFFFFLPKIMTRNISNRHNKQVGSKRDSNQDSKLLAKSSIDW